MSTKQRRRYGPIRAGAETNAGTNEEVFDKFFGSGPAPARQTPPIPETAPVSLTPTPQTAPLTDTPRPLPETAPVTREAPVRQAPSGFTMVTHQVSDEVMKTLDVYSQSVLQRLLRLTWGHQKDVCKVGLPKLSEYCNISLSQTRRAVRMLIQRGFVEQVIQDFEDPAQEMRGTVYRVLLERAPTRQRGATHQTAPAQQTPNKERALKKSSKKVDASLCPDCKGDGYYFTNPADSTTLRLCRHERAPLPAD